MHNKRSKYIININFVSTYQFLLHIKKSKNRNSLADRYAAVATSRKSLQIVWKKIIFGTSFLIPNKFNVYYQFEKLLAIKYYVQPNTLLLNNLLSNNNSALKKNLYLRN